MKKFLLSLCVVLLSCVTFAQNVVVVLKDGTEVRYAAADIDSIRIEKIAAEEATAVPVEETGLHFFYDIYSMTAHVDGLINMEATEVKIPSKVSVDGKVYDVVGIAKQAFYGCKNLVSVEIPNSVTEIENSAFEGCTGLTSIKIPNSVTELGSYVFADCKNLESVEISNSITKIGVSAFHLCRSLKSVEIPKTVTTIGVSAFAFCTSLESVTIPTSVTEIKKGAFDGCENLKSVRVPKDCIVGEDAFFYYCEIEYY